MDIDRDKAEIVASLVRFWQAYERKDLATMSEMLTTSSDFTFFGSDAAEVVRTRRDWEELMRNDWQLFETTKFGEPSNVAIQISDDGKLASAVYEVPDISLVEGKSSRPLCHHNEKGERDLADRSGDDGCGNARGIHFRNCDSKKDEGTEKVSMHQTNQERNALHWQRGT